MKTAKGVYVKAKICELSRDFGGTMKDDELMKLIKVSRSTFYKYKKEIRDQVEDTIVLPTDKEQ